MNLHVITLRKLFMKQKVKLFYKYELKDKIKLF